jgi:hypothetical protein
VSERGKRKRKEKKQIHLLGADGLVLLLPCGDVAAAAAVEPVADAPPVEGKSGNRDIEEKE